MIVARFWTGVGSSVFSTMVGGVVSDLYHAEHRNTPMALFSGGVCKYKTSSLSSYPRSHSCFNLLCALFLPDLSLVDEISSIFLSVLSISRNSDFPVI